MNVYNSITNGLTQAIDYEKGLIKAKKVKYIVVPVPTFDSKEIKHLRQMMGMTQVLFAAVMGVSPKTVEAWESGKNVPDGAARRMLGILRQGPKILLKYKIVSVL